MAIIVPVRNLLGAIFALLLLSGCAAQLVPEYDQALAEGLNESNEQALTLFAKVESGSEAEDFAKLEDDYAALIGRFDALRQRASARYVPPLAARLSKMKIVRDFCVSESAPNECLNATPASITELLSNLRKMRDVHRQSGLDPGAVVAFRNRYDIQIDQALTVENALKR